MRRPRTAFSDDATVDEIAEWLQFIYVGTPYDTRLRRGVKACLRDMHANRKAWIGLNGVGGIGKTELLMHLMLQMSEWDADGNHLEREINGYLQRSVVFVEASSVEKGRGLYSGICTALGLDAEGSERILSRKLIDTLPLFGVRIVIVDDSHFYRRVTASALLTDTLRATLRLPVLFIYAGAQIELSALLKRAGGPGFDSIDQMVKRCKLLDMAPLKLPADESAVQDLVKRYAKQATRAIPGLTYPALKSGPTLGELVRLSDGLPGTMLVAMKDATCDAIEAGTRSVTSELLLQCAPSEPGEPVRL